MSLDAGGWAMPSRPAGERAIEQPAMADRAAAVIEQGTGPDRAEAVPNHIGEPRIGDGVHDLEAVDVGTDHADRRYHRQLVAAGADDELRRVDAAKIHRLEEMDVPGRLHPDAARHQRAECELLHVVFDLVLLDPGSGAAHGIGRTIHDSAGTFADISANWSRSNCTNADGSPFGSAAFASSTTTTPKSPRRATKTPLRSRQARSIGCRSMKRNQPSPARLQSS